MKRTNLLRFVKSMQITRACEYGVLGLLALARRQPGEVVMLEVISREEAIPVSFLGKIFQGLAKAGLIRSARGSGGGFCLTRPAEEVTVLQVIEGLEGPIALQRCLESEPECEHIGGCALCGLLAEAQDKVREVFSRTTLAQLAGRHLAPGLFRKACPEAPMVPSVAATTDATHHAPPAELPPGGTAAAPMLFSATPFSCVSELSVSPT